VASYARDGTKVPRGRRVPWRSPRKIFFAGGRIRDNTYEDAGSVCAARSSQGAWRTSGRSVAAPSADHACHLPRTTARSRAVCTVSGTHRASGVVPEDFPVRIRLWVALNVPPDLYQLPVTVSWAPSRCTSVHSIPHASPRRRLRCPTTAERRAGRPPGCHTPAGAGAYEASMSAVSSGQPNVPPETLRDCRVTRYLLLRLRPVQSSSAVPAGLPTGPRPRRSSRLPLLRQMPRPAGAGDPQG
jgi:hypothetical protein